MAKISRTRGATYEREVANEIFDMLGIRIKRNLKQYQQSEEGDLILGQFLIECKRRKKIAVHEFMEQADKACEPGQTPVVIMRADGKKSLAMMHLPDLLKLLGSELEDPHQSQGESPVGDS
jgi:N-dimethylarginine dimethylaminohydrolase